MDMYLANSRDKSIIAGPVSCTYGKEATFPINDQTHCDHYILCDEEGPRFYAPTQYKMDLCPGDTVNVTVPIMPDWVLELFE